MGHYCSCLLPNRVVEHSKSKSTQPRSETFWVTLYTFIQWICRECLTTRDPTSQDPITTSDTSSEKSCACGLHRIIEV